MIREVTIVLTGTANLASVIGAFKRAGAEPRVASNASELNQARAIVLPGVGSFGAAISALESAGYEDILRERISAGIPTLAICLGMQILFEGSEESPNVRGLSILPGRFERFPNSIRTPHVGWNSIKPYGTTRLLQRGDAYFTHSYRLADLPAGSSGSMTDYSTPFVSAIEYGNILACQFHPELSGPWGLALLQRWIQQEDFPC